MGAPSMCPACVLRVQSAPGVHVGPLDDAVVPVVHVLGHYHRQALPDEVLLCNSEHHLSPGARLRHNPLGVDPDNRLHSLKRPDLQRKEEATENEILFASKLAKGLSQSRRRARSRETNARLMLRPVRAYPELDDGRIHVCFRLHSYGHQSPHLKAGVADDGVSSGAAHSEQQHAASVNSEQRRGCE